MGWVDGYWVEGGALSGIMFLLFIVHSLLFQITLNPFHPEYCAFTVAIQGILFPLFIVHNILFQITLNPFDPEKSAFSYTVYTVYCSRWHLTLSTPSTDLVAIHGRMFLLFIVHSPLFLITLNPFHPEYGDFSYTVHGRMFPLFYSTHCPVPDYIYSFYPEYCTCSYIYSTYLHGMLYCTKET